MLSGKLLETLLEELVEEIELADKLLLIFSFVDGLLDEEEQDGKLVEREL